MTPCLVVFNYSKCPTHQVLKKLMGCMVPTSICSCQLTSKHLCTGRPKPAQDERYVRLPLHISISCSLGWCLRGRWSQRLLLECMKTYLHKEKWQFCQEDWQFWLYCCMNNLYTTHRLIYAQGSSFWSLSSMLTCISHFWVTSCFNSVHIIVACCVNFREKC